MGLPCILRKMREGWDRRAGDHDIRRLWAASCLHHFGFLRAGEMAVLCDSSYNPKVHLNLAVDDPRILRITVKQSKTRRERNRPVTGHRSDDVLPRKSNVELPGGERSQRGVSGMDAFLRDSVLYSMLERS